MSSRTIATTVLVVSVAALAGCGPGASSATSPSPSPSPAPSPAPTLIGFKDPESGLSITALRDADDQVIHINTAGELIWVADGTRLPGYTLIHDDYIPCRPCDGWLEVRFGTKDGERRAYLTVEYGHSNPGSLIDLDVVGGALIATRTNVFPPGTYTLSGRVTEATPTGVVPLEGVNVTRGYPAVWIDTTTDGKGFYEIHGLYHHDDSVLVRKDGYQTQEIWVAVGGDTRFDIQLVRQ